MDFDDPIYKFDGLKSLLKEMGYRIDKAVGYKALKIADVNINDIRKNIKFTDKGIFLIDEEDNQEREIFLYKQKYQLLLYGKPRFHIRKCQIIEDFIKKGSFKAEYRRANSEPVLVIDIDNEGKEVQISNLPLCKYCLKMAMGEYSTNMTSADFVAILKQADNSYFENTDLEVDIQGYAKDWQMISLAYRELREYTCEKCGLHITDHFDQFYMQTHHKNGNKIDNRQSNLQCLCIRCHANMDERHRVNFKRGAEQIRLNEFNSKYPQ